MSNLPLDASATVTAPVCLRPRRASDLPGDDADAGETAAAAVAPRKLAERYSSATAPGAVPTRTYAVHLACRNLFKSYRKGAIGIPVLQGIDLDVHKGEFLAIVGQSGCGKSTLLHLLGTLDQPDAGAVSFEGHRIDDLPATARDLLRNRHFGMIFQFYHLLPELSTLENVLAPALIAEGALGYWLRRSQHRRRALDLLNLVGLSHRAKHKPRELSGGEMQRAAIARALLSRPKVLLADEPTGNLDRSTGEQIMHILGELNRRDGLTIVMVTHDPWIAGQADRTVHLVEGRIQRT
ncbi:MAG: ABC transporter ATP-binding protein [Pirellulales bacterium]|nr:ABC transporter ATP-binding protein [Pirellulales bacterium]